MIEELKSPLIVALDFNDPDKAFDLANQIYKDVGAFKIGPRLCLKDSNIIGSLKQLSPVFIDFKFFDIPNTMVESVKSSFFMGATFVTVHLLSGKESLKEVFKVEENHSKVNFKKVLGVSMLTSFDDQNLPLSLKTKSIEDHVDSLIQEGYECGLRGFVCSPHEIKKIKTKYPDSFLVTPGIRLEKSVDDQKRTLTPEEAVSLGADAIVVGRPIIESENPKKVVDDILRRIYSV